MAEIARNGRSLVSDEVCLKESVRVLENSERMVAVASASLKAAVMANIPC